MGSGILAPVSIADVCVSGVTVLGANAAPRTPLQLGDLVTVWGTCPRVRPSNEAVLTSSVSHVWLQCFGSTIEHTSFGEVDQCPRMALDVSQ